MNKANSSRRANFRWQWEHNRAAFITWLLLRLSVLAVMIRAAMQGYWENLFICLLVLFLFQLPSVLEKRLRITLPSGLQIIILVHIFACEILGEIACYYVRYPYWDTVMHTAWGFLCAAIGYALVELLNRENAAHFHLSPVFLAVVAFCFSMTIGVLWELFEFSMDRLFLLDMQKDSVITYFASTLLDATRSNIPIRVQSIKDVAVNGESLGLTGYLDIGLLDTMEDLIVNMIGALVFSTLGLLRSKSEKARRIAETFIPQVTAPVSEETDGHT